MNRPEPPRAPVDRRSPEHTSLTVGVPDELVELIARRVVELLRDELDSPGGGYLDVDAAATFLACGKRRVYDLVERGALRAHRDGRRLLFVRADLEAAVRGPE